MFIHPDKVMNDIFPKEGEEILKEVYIQLRIVQDDIKTSREKIETLTPYRMNF
jgi:hypothetical protein